MVVIPSFALDQASAVSGESWQGVLVKSEVVYNKNMKRSFKINEKTIKYDLNYFFRETEILDAFMDAFEKFCKRSYKNKVLSFKAKEIGVSRILKAINKDDESIRIKFIKSLRKDVVNQGWLIYITFIILDFEEFNNLRLELMRFIIDNFSELANLYSFEMFEYIEAEYQTIDVPIKEKQLREKFSEIVSSKKQEIDTDKFWCFDSDLWNVANRFRGQEEWVKEVAIDCIKRGKFSTSLYGGKGYNFRKSFQTLLQERGIAEEFSREVMGCKLLIKSYKEFERKFK